MDKKSQNVIGVEFSKEDIDGCRAIAKASGLTAGSTKIDPHMNLEGFCSASILGFE